MGSRQQASGRALLQLHSQLPGYWQLMLVSGNKVPTPVRQLLWKKYW
jgi:hypothetical protein